MTAFLFTGEIHHAVNLSKPKIIFVSQMNFVKAVKVRAANNFITAIVAFDSIHQHCESQVIAYKELLEIAVIGSSKPFKCAPQNMKENVCLILCSSGTTGLPKGVQLAQYNIIVADSQH